MNEHYEIASDERLRALIGQIRLHDVPADLHQRLAGLFAGSAQRTQVPELRRHIEAILRSEGFGGHALAGARGGGSTRQLLFTADDVDVSIQVGPSEEGVTNLDGMVLHGDGADRVCAVRVEGQGRVVQELATTEVGSFRVRRLPSGKYTVIVAVDDCDVVIGPIDISP